MYTTLDGLFFNVPETIKGSELFWVKANNKEIPAKKTIFRIQIFLAIKFLIQNFVHNFGISPALRSFDYFTHEQCKQAFFSFPVFLYFFFKLLKYSICNWSDKI